MAEPIPLWVGKYVGIEFKDRGRDLAGCDCWGLVRIVLHDEFNLDFKSLADGYSHHDDLKAVEKVYKEEAEKEDWVSIPDGSELLGDVVCFRIKSHPCHVGLVISPGMMLHIERGSNSCFVPYNNIKWKNRIENFHRPRALIRDAAII